MRIVSGGSGSDDRHVRIASTLTGGGVLGASVLLPEGRRTSLPVLLPERPRASDPEFVVPRIQVSYWNTSVGGSIPPPPSATPKSIPAEMRPVTRQRSKSSTRTWTQIVFSNDPPKKKLKRETNLVTNVILFYTLKWKPHQSKTNDKMNYVWKLLLIIITIIIIIINENIMIRKRRTRTYTTTRREFLFFSFWILTAK